MIIENTTITIEKSIEKIWIGWVKEQYIPLFLNTGLCDCKLLKIEQKYEEDAVSFALQLSFPDKKDFAEYKERHKNKLSKLLNIKFRNKFVCFSTLLEEL